MSGALFAVTVGAVLVTARLLALRGADWSRPLWFVIAHPAWWARSPEYAPVLLAGSVLVTIVALLVCAALLRPGPPRRGGS